MLATACAGSEPSRQTVAPGDIVTLDFVGELAAADTAEWQQYVDGSSDDIYRTSGGGRTSELLVGPATLTLDDGTVVDVPASTPGGNLCPQLDLWQQPPDPPPRLDPREACVVVGQYRAGTTAAAWFSTLRVRRTTVGPPGFVVDSVGVEPGGVIVPIGGTTHVAVPIGPDVVVECFGLTLGELLTEGLGVGASLDGDFALLGLECVGRE